MTHRIIAGFMPLLDSALLVAARAKGFAEAEGIDLGLLRESSWANIRDRLAVGHVQVAHMLGPMPIAGNLGLTPLAARTVVPMALGLSGGGVFISKPLAIVVIGGLLSSTLLTLLLVPVLYSLVEGRLEKRRGGFPTASNAPERSALVEEEPARPRRSR